MAGLTLVVTGCGQNGTRDGKPVSKVQFEEAGLRWPLTVTSGRIGCDRTMYWFESEDGTRYGLNGFATEHGYSDLEPIWAVDEKMMGEARSAGAADAPVVRISIGDMAQEASKLC